MPHNPDNKRLLIVVSPAQHQALAGLAKEHQMDIADLIRQTLLEKFPSIPDDLPARGKYKRNGNNS